MSDRPTNWTIVGQEPTKLAVGASVGFLGYFLSPSLMFLSLSLSLETSQYRLKYCLKGPFNQNRVCLVKQDKPLEKISIQVILH